MAEIDTITSVADLEGMTRTLAVEFSEDSAKAYLDGEIDMTDVKSFDDVLSKALMAISEDNHDTVYVVLKITKGE